MWFVFALSAAFLDVIIDFLGKKGFENNSFSPFTITWGITFFGGLFLFPFVIWLGFPLIEDNIFWLILLLSSILNVIAHYYYYSALQNADLSLVGPLTCFTPVFLLITSPFFLFISGYNITDELPNLQGIFGVFLIFSGSYILNIYQSEKGFFEPFKIIFFNVFLRKGILAAFLWSITMGLAKLAITSISGANYLQKAVFWGDIFLFTVAIFTFPFMIKELRQNDNINIINNYRKWLFLMIIGFLNGLLMGFQMIAISLIVAAYAISVKRLSNVFKVILGAFFLNESHLKERLLAVLIMFIGVIFITINNLIPNIYNWLNLFV